MLDLSELIGPSLDELPAPQKHLLTHLQEDGEFTPHPDPTLLHPGDLLTLQLRGKVRSAVVETVNETSLTCLSATARAVKDAVNKHKRNQRLDVEWLANYESLRAYHSWQYYQQEDFWPTLELNTKAAKEATAFDSAEQAQTQTYDAVYKRAQAIKDKALVTPFSSVVIFTKHTVTLTSAGLHTFADNDKNMLSYFQDRANQLSTYERILLSNVRENLAFTPHPNLAELQLGDLVTFTFADNTRTAVVTKLGPKIGVITTTRTRVLKTTKDFFYYLNLDVPAHCHTSAKAAFEEYNPGQTYDPDSYDGQRHYEPYYDYASGRQAKAQNAATPCGMIFTVRNLLPEQIGIYT